MKDPNAHDQYTAGGTLLVGVEDRSGHVCGVSERWSLPPAAVREAIVNAVAHADYAQRGAPLRVSIFDDRLEVENPGQLTSAPPPPFQPSRLAFR